MHVGNLVEVMDTTVRIVCESFSLCELMLYSGKALTDWFVQLVNNFISVARVCHMSLLMEFTV